VAIQYQRPEQRAYSKPIPEPVVEKKYSGAFAALGDDSDQENEKPVPKVAVPVDEFPALLGSKKEVTSIANTVSWAAMAEKPAAPVLKPLVKTTPQIVGKKWADYSDSDSEEEEFQSAPLVRTASVYNAPCYESRSSYDDEDW